MGVVEDILANLGYDSTPTVTLGSPLPYVERMLTPTGRRYNNPGHLASRMDPKHGTSPALDMIDDALVDLMKPDSDCDALMVFMPPQEGKPVIVSSMVLMGDGSRKRLRDIQVGDYVISHKGRPCRVTAVHEQGALPIVKITTHAGRVIRAAADHPFMTPEGWTEAGKLTPGDSLAAVKSPDVDAQPTLTYEAARLLGYFVGDGNTTASAANLNASITCHDAIEEADILNCAAALDFAATAKGKRVLLSTGVRPWLREHGLAGCTSWTKRVPAAIFTQPSDIIAQFIGAYFACDGTVSRRGGSRPDCRLEFYSVAEDLLRDVQHLLLRLGIASTLRPKGSIWDGKPYVSWRLMIRRQDDAARFRALIPMHSVKADVLGAWELHRTEFDSLYAADPVVTVEREDPEECRCLTVETDHTFTADDVVVHNSQKVSRRFPEWLLDHDPSLRIAIVSYEQDTALRWGRDIKQDVALNRCRKVATDHTECQEACGGLHITIRRDSSAAARWETPAGGGVYCVGVGGPLTGRPVDVLIIDDPVKDRAAAESKTIRESTWDWWESVALTRLAPNARVILVMTRWHEDDLAGRLETRPGPLNWRRITIPAIAEDGDQLGRRKGQELPSVRKRAAGYFHRLKATMSAYVFSGVYQQSPTAPEGNFFRRQTFRYWREVDPFPDGRVRLSLEGQMVALEDTWRFITMDFAASSKATADYTVASVWAVDLSGNLLLLDRVREHIPDHDHFRLTFPLLAQWKADTIWVEANWWSSTFVTDARNAGVPVAMLRADTDKITRAVPAAGRVHAGKVFFPAEASWLDTWCDELATFPKATHDDQVDTLAYAARILVNEWTPGQDLPRPGLTPQEQAINSASAASTGYGSELDIMNVPY